MKRYLVAAASTLVVAALAVAGPSTPAGAAPNPSCSTPSWFGGSVDICDGVLVYRDYVYDDEGADTGSTGDADTHNTAGAFGTLATPAGDIRYPTTDINTADLVRLELKRVGNTVQVKAELNALFHPTSTILELAVDTDGNNATGGGTWTGLSIKSTGWDKIYRITTGNVTTNTMTGSFPLPSAATWRIQAVTAQASTGDVMNVAFRGVDERASWSLAVNTSVPEPYTGQGTWFEDKQAAALKAGDISQFGQTVKTADLAPTVQRAQPAVTPGLHERVYTSAYTIAPGEGMAYTAVPGRGSGGSTTLFAQTFNFLGKYQPYGVYIPKGTGPYGLQMEWHGSNQGLVAQINQPGMQKAYGEGQHRLLVVPEARGPNGYGADVSERDLLDVMADARKTFAVDPNRIFSSGYSQGGYLTFRMAMLYPDVFAGYSGWVAFTGDDLNGTGAPPGTVSVTAGAVGNMIRYTPNLRHVPGSMIYGGADELVPISSSRAMQQSFAATDDVYRWYLHPTAEHLTFSILDGWDKEAADSANQRLVTRPARVTFLTNPLLDAKDFGIRHDKAYWVSQLRGRLDGDLLTDLTSHGCGVDVPALATTNATGQSPVPWTSIDQQVTGHTTLPAQAYLEGTLTNVASLRIDRSTSGACLTGPFDYRIVSDGPGTITFSDGRTLRLVQGVNQGRLGNATS